MLLKLLVASKNKKLTKNPLTNKQTNILNLCYTAGLNAHAALQMRYIQNFLLYIYFNVELYKSRGTTFYYSSTTNQARIKKKV